ncbi:hypothetical protein BGZ94_009127 [Podila epigama]|nr:hypothetical protein BGZ94_009127 [Podila epigama]
MASLRFMTLNDIVNLRATASMLYHSIPMPNAVMILQAAYLLQIRPQRGCRSEQSQTPISPTQHHQNSYLNKSTSRVCYLPLSASTPQKDLYVTYRDHELKDIIRRLTKILVHPEFHPRLMRCSYSFRHRQHHDSHPSHHNEHSSEPTTSTQQAQKTMTSRKRQERKRRDLYDYPIFITGNPPDLVRLAIEFGHVPFVDHLLSRGFRPRDLPEYFGMIPFMMPESDTLLELEGQISKGGNVNRQVIEAKRAEAMARHQQRQAVMMQRSMELNQIWECMRASNQELMDACSRADLAAVRKVLDATLIHERVALDDPTELEQTWSETIPGPNDIKGKGKAKGKQRAGGQDDLLDDRSRQGSIGTSPDEFDDDERVEILGSGVGAGTGGSMSTLESSTRRQPQIHITARHAGPRPAHHLDISQQQPNPLQQYIPPPPPSYLPSSHSSAGFDPTQPLLIHRASIFKMRERTESDVEDEAPSAGTSSDHDRLSNYKGDYNNNNDIYVDHAKDNHGSTHMPWVDGRALTSALLAICFRRNGVESSEAQAVEEAKAVAIMNEILKYDCMLTAQSLVQAALGVVYSRPRGSLKRVQQQRQQALQTKRHSGYPKSLQTPRDAPHTDHQSADDGRDTKHEGIGLTAMDLLMERMGPREWLKLIKCYLQRREFEDLAVVLEQCPFKGPQLETREKAPSHQPDSGTTSTGSTSSDTSSHTSVSGTMPRFMNQAHHQQHQQHGYNNDDPVPSRELICREAGICGVGTRLNQFTVRGIGQPSCQVSSTLHESSRVLFTGSGTRFSHTFMLPRGGFRGIGGNSSGHTRNASGSGYAQDADSNDNAGGVGDEYASTHAQPAFGIGGSDDNPSQFNQYLHPTPPNEFSQPTHHYQADDGGEEEEEDEEEEEEDEDDDEEGVEDDEEEQGMSGIHPSPEGTQDSNLAFGGVGSSTTSSSRPGPGIVGIAIQVQAPEAILRALFKMGFRFFSICDLSIPDTRHPLALQFRHQEKVNRLLIEFCMVPNLDGHGGLDRNEDEDLEEENYSDEEGGEDYDAMVVDDDEEYRRKVAAKRRRRQQQRRRRRQRNIDPADLEHHRQAVQRFLYPAANNPNRGSVSIPILPSMVPERRASPNIGRTRVHRQQPRQQQPPRPPRPAAMSIPLPMAPETESTTPDGTEEGSSTLARNAGTLTPSNRLQFVLPPVQLGESFGSIASLANFDLCDVVLGQDENKDLSVDNEDYINGRGVGNSSKHSTPRRSRYPPLALNSPLYAKSGLSKSMPLPIRASMIECRTRFEGSFFHFGHPLYQNEAQQREDRRRTLEAQRRRVQETMTRRVRDHLTSEYVDLMTVGICLYQACYHRKEHLLKVILEHRLLIAQDALTGAVQVAGSVGWRRGLEILLVEQGDIEAEVEPVVVVTSEHVHLGTSMKWDHASAAQLYQGSGTLGSMQQSNRTLHHHNNNNYMDGSGLISGSSTAGSGNGGFGYGLRRHRSDGGRIHQLYTGEGSSSNSLGIQQQQQPQQPPQQSQSPRRASFDYYSSSPLFSPPGGYFSSPPMSDASSPSLFSPVLPHSAAATVTASPSRRGSESEGEVLGGISGMGVVGESMLSAGGGGGGGTIGNGNRSGRRRRSVLKSKLSMLLPSSHQAKHSTSPSSASVPGFQAPPSQKYRETRRSSLGGMVTTTTTPAGGGAGGSLFPITTTTEVSSTTMIMLSSSGLWSLPSTMMLRKSRNAVVALMAACTRNDPSLVRWLVETFADIKMAHVMQALMIACDRGLIRVVKVLVGVRRVPLTAAASQTHAHTRRYRGGDGQRQSQEGPHRGRKNRDLFRQWLEGQHQRILALTTSVTATAAATAAATAMSSATSPQHPLAPNPDPPVASTTGSGSGSGSTLASHHDSFPFLFMMESSPLFRHYYQILNTLSTCQFMSWKPPAASAKTRALQRAPLEIKYELIQILLTPLLEVLGPISLRKAINRMPKDCWWPMDEDVRSVIDEEASRAMVILASELRLQKKQREMEQQQRVQQQQSSFQQPFRRLQQRWSRQGAEMEFPSMDAMPGVQGNTEEDIAGDRVGIRRRRRGGGGIKRRSRPISQWFEDRLGLTRSQAADTLNVKGMDASSGKRISRVFQWMIPRKKTTNNDDDQHNMYTYNDNHDNFVTDLNNSTVIMESTVGEVLPAISVPFGEKSIKKKGEMTIAAVSDGAEFLSKGHRQDPGPKAFFRRFSLPLKN